jgi:hypothetical protein
MIFKSKKVLILLSCGLFLLGLGLFAYLGTFNRYYADDWCYNQDLHRLGLVGTLKGYTYITTYASNRYSLTLFSGLIYFLGIFGVQSMTLLTLLVWLGGVYWTLDNLKKINHWLLPRKLVFLIAVMILYFSVYLAPHLYQNLYWRSGLLPYTAPLVFIPYITGAITHQVRRVKSSITLMVIAAITTTLVGGFSEAASVYLVVFLGVYTIAAAIGAWNKKNWGRVTIWTAVIALGFAVLAMFVLIASPANEIRQLEAYGSPTSLFVLPRLALIYTYFYLRVTTSSHVLPFLVVFSLPLALAYLQEPVKTFKLTGRQTILMMFIIVIGTGLLVAASLTPNLYIERGMPAPRAQIIPLFTTITSTAALGWLMGTYFRSKVKATRINIAGALDITAIILICLGCLYTVQTLSITSGKIPIYAERAVIWDERDRYIREAAKQGTEIVDVYGIDSQPVDGLHDLKPDGKHWVNHCAARYYGVKSIRASKDLE